MTKERNEDGRYTQSVTDGEIAQYVADAGPVGTADVADKFSLARSGAYRRLKLLEDAGRVQSSHIGNSLAWTEADA